MRNSRRVLNRAHRIMYVTLRVIGYIIMFVSARKYHFVFRVSYADNPHLLRFEGLRAAETERIRICQQQQCM